MATNIFSIGISGLQAAQAGLVTAGHNIANANTPGYTRQEVDYTNAIPTASGSGFFGNGVDTVTVRRLYSQFLTSEVLSASTQSNALDSYYSQIQQLDNLVADPSAGLSPALQDFFTAVQGVAATPNVASARQAMLSSAQALKSRFDVIDQRIQDLRDGVNEDVGATAQEITNYAGQIADLNQRIIVARSAAGGQPPNDLMDQRDQLVAQLNKDVKATIVVQDDGAYNVFIGSGQPLVAGVQAYTVTTLRDPLDPTKVTIGYKTPSGVVQLPEASLTGGKLGGLLSFRNQTLDPAQNALGRVAAALAQTFNAQLRLGQDLNGQPGTDLFSIGTPRVTPSTNNTGNATIAGAFDPANVGALTTSDYRLTFDGTNYALTRLSDGNVRSFATLPQNVDGFTLSLASGAAVAGDTFLIRPTVDGAQSFDVALTDPSKIAAAAPVRTSQGTANTGTGKVSAGVVNALNANLQQPVTITFTSPTTFDVTGTGTGNPTGVTYTPGQDITFNGWTIQISGTPAAGDTFGVGPNSGGTGDNRNALLLAGLQTQKILDGGTASYQGAYAAFVSDVGTQTRQLQVTSSAQAAVLEQATTAQQAQSGVSLDEEAANLIRFQQAYQASGKVLQIASTLFDTLLALGNNT
ncbi:MAG TPA: flagellar hook-associated protein FlgK [Burkholderiales bacterium]|nr:flagellar hook-associated protein FlgK [Burkholderiales bacterium]